MNIRECYAALEIEAGADKIKIRQAYRDLVTIWHPDQYQENPRLQEKATEKLKEINAAYDTLMKRGKADHIGLGPDRETVKGQTQTDTAPRTRHQAAVVNKKRALFIWVLLLAALTVTALALYVYLPFPRPGSQKQGPLYHDESSAQALAAVRLDPKQIAQLQRELVVMGYDSGPADGKMDPQTIMAAQQFAIDFQVNRGSNFIESLLAESTRQAAVTRVHADWPTVAGSREFDHWIENQIITSPNICRDVLSSGSATQMISMIDSYIFDKDKPPFEALPETGTLKKRLYRGMAPLKIKTRNEGRHFFVKLIEQPEQKEVLTLFIRSGDMLKLHIPLGVYTLKYAVGHTWYGSRWLFGSETVFNSLAEDIEFAFQDNAISGYSIELYIEPKLLSKKESDYTFDF
jgi:curved DNA-binding protein CbpA